MHIGNFDIKWEDPMVQIVYFHRPFHVLGPFDSKEEGWSAAEQFLRRQLESALERLDAGVFRATKDVNAEKWYPEMPGTKNFETHYEFNGCLVKDGDWVVDKFSVFSDEDFRNNFSCTDEDTKHGTLYSKIAAQPQCYRRRQPVNAIHWTSEAILFSRGKVSI